MAVERQRLGQIDGGMLQDEHRGVQLQEPIKPACVGDGVGGEVRYTDAPVGCRLFFGRICAADAVLVAGTGKAVIPGFGDALPVQERVEPDRGKPVRVGAVIPGISVRLSKPGCGKDPGKQVKALAFGCGVRGIGVREAADKDTVWLVQTVRPDRDADFTPAGLLVKQGADTVKGGGFLFPSYHF